MLNLNLYDTTGDEDIFINQVLVDTGIAVFLENPEEQAGERFLAHFCKRIVQVFFFLVIPFGCLVLCYLGNLVQPPLDYLKGVNSESRNPC